MVKVGPFLLLSLTVILLGTRSAYAVDCPALLKMPVVLEQTKTRKFPIELQKAGRVYHPGEAVLPADLESNLYHYAFTAKNELLLTPAYIGKRLATHKSLVAMYQTTTGEDPRIVAAGDMILAFGYVVFLDNRSGNFRGGQENLEYAHQELKAYGLRFDPKAIVEVHIPGHVNDQIKGHTPEGIAVHKFNLDIRDRLRKMKHGSEFLALHEKTVITLIRIMGATGPYQAENDLYAIPKTLADYESETFFREPLRTALLMDGASYGLYTTLGTVTSTQFARFMAHEIRRYARALTDRTTPAEQAGPITSAQRAELETLAAEFDRLADL